MKKKKVLIGIAGLFVLAAALTSITVTKQNEYKLIRQFGKVQRVIDKPGISLRIPVVETTVTLPKQTLLYDLAPSDVITRDKKTMITDSYVIWKISDPLKFARTLNSSIENGESRINTAIYNATKNAISSMSQDEVITSRDGAQKRYNHSLELLLKNIENNDGTLTHPSVFYLANDGASWKLRDDGQAIGIGIFGDLSTTPVADEEES